VNDTVIILCFFFCLQGLAVGRQSGCAVQCTNYKHLYTANIFQRLILRILNLVHVPLN